MKKTPACEPAPAPAPGRDRSLYVVSTVIVLCLVTLALGLYFTTTDRTRPTSTAVTTAATPAPLETTTPATTKIPDIPGTIICLTEHISQNMDALVDLCSHIGILLTFREDGQVKQDSLVLQHLRTSFGSNFVTGIKFQENQELSYLETMAKTEEWNLADSHAITEVLLKTETAHIIQDAATRVMKMEIIDLLATSKVDATLKILPALKGVKLFTVRPECDTFSWNQTSALDLTFAIKNKVEKAIALSLSAALWMKNQDEQGGKCSGWIDGTDDVKYCMETGGSFEQCRMKTLVLVDNATIAALANYARSKHINTFCIRNAEKVVETLFLHRSFHLLNFTLPVVPATIRMPPSSLLQQPGLDDSPSSGSHLPAMRASSVTWSNTEPVRSGLSVEAAEHRGMSGVAKASSSDAKSAKLKRTTSGTRSNFGVGEKEPAPPQSPNPPKLETTRHPLDVQ